MNKILLISFVVLGLYLINIFAINTYSNNISGKKLYENKDFSGSLDYFKKNKDYIGLYNLGNVSYKLGEKIKTTKSLSEAKKENFWKKALEYYKNSMKIQYTKQAEENYNFVKDKLEELNKNKKKEQEKKKEKNQEQQENNENKKGEENKDKDKNREENKNKNGEKKSGEKKENKEGQQDTKKGKQSKDGKSQPQLSPQVKQQIKAYEEKLKQEQKDNVGNFGKVYEEQKNPFDDFDEFFNNPLFDNSILDKNEKKDW